MKGGGAVTKILIIVLLLALALPFSARPSEGLHWSQKASISPKTIYRGTYTKFTFTVSNTANEQLDIYSVWIHFCWEPTGYGYAFKEESSTPQTISALDSQGYSLTLDVPHDTPGTCNLSAQVVGKATSDLYPQTATYNDSFAAITPPLLVVSAVANTSSGFSPFTVDFSVVATGGVGPYTYEWWFGDGFTSTTKNPTHSYENPGNFHATVGVTDSIGQHQEASTTVTVKPSSTLASGLVGGGGLWIIFGLVIVVAVLLGAVIFQRGRAEAYRRWLRQSYREPIPPPPGPPPPLATGGTVDQPPVQLPRPPQGFSCKNCGNPLSSGAISYEKCGAKVG